MLKWKSESCDIEKFALAYIKHDELVQNTFSNDKSKLYRAYAAVGKELGMPVSHVRGFETVFKRRYLEMVQRAQTPAAWVAAAEARLRVRARLAEGVVRALRQAARAHGALCSRGVYRRVARALRLRAAPAALHAAWVRLQLASLRLLAAAARAGDAPARAPPRLHAQLADLVLLHTDVAANALLTEESEAIFLEESALRTLCELVRRHRAEQRAPPARVSRMRAQRWSRVYRDYRDSKRIASVVVLQRRWHELKVLSVRALRSYWRRTRAHDPAQGPAHADIDPDLPLPTPLQLKVLTEYPHIASGPVPRWRSLVRQGEVITAPLSDGEYEQEDPPCGVPLRRARTSDDEDEDPQKRKLKQDGGTELDRASKLASTSAGYFTNTPASMLASSCIGMHAVNANTAPDKMDVVSLLQTLDLDKTSTEVLMDSDEHKLVIDEDVKPDIDLTTGEVVVKTEPGEPAWSGRSMADRIVFTDDDASSIEISDDSDYCDDFDEDYVSSDNNFDEKILYVPRVTLTRVEDLPAWRRYSVDGRRILTRHWTDSTDPPDPPDLTLPGGGRTQSRGGATKRKLPPYCNLAADGAGKAGNLSFYEEGPYPTLEEIREMVVELSVMPLSRELRPGSGEFCCAARQQQHESDERRRAGLLALPAHCCPAGEQCSCCCADLCPATTSARLATLLDQLQRTVTAMLPVRSWPREEATDTQSLNDELSPGTSNINKCKKKKKPRPKKPKLTNVETPSTSEDNAGVTNAYDEWIRQKNVNKFYFTVPGANSENKNNSYKTNAKKENKNKTDNIAQTREKILVSPTSLTTVTTPIITTTASSTAAGSVIAMTPTSTIITTPTCLMSSLDMSTRSVNIASKPVRLTPIAAIYLSVPVSRPEPVTSNDEVICISDEETKIKEEPEEECSERIKTPTSQVAIVPALQYSAPISFPNNIGTTLKHDHTYSSVRFQNNTLNRPVASRLTAPGTLKPVRLKIPPGPRPTCFEQGSVMVNNKSAPEVKQTVYLTLQPLSMPVNTHAVTNVVSEANVPQSIDNQSKVKGPVENGSNEQNQVDSPSANVVSINVEKTDNVVVKTSVVFETEHVLKEKANEAAASTVQISFTVRNSMAPNLSPGTSNKKSQEITLDHPKTTTELDKAGEQSTCPEPVVSVTPISKDTIQPVKEAVSIERANNAKQQVDRVAAPGSSHDSARNGSDYDEWIGQKNINSQYFQTWVDLKKPAKYTKSPKFLKKSSFSKQKATISKKRSTAPASAQCGVKDKVPANEQVKDEIPSEPFDDTSLCSDAHNLVQNNTIDAHAQSELPLHGTLLQSELAVHNAMVQNFTPSYGQSVNNDISFHRVPILRENPDNSEPAENKLLLQDATIPSERPPHEPVEYTANTNNTNHNDKNSSLTYPTNIMDNNLTTLEGSPDPKQINAMGQNPHNQNDILHSNGPLYIDIPKNTNDLLPDFSDDEGELSSSTISENIIKSLEMLEQPRIPTLIVGEYPPERSNKLISPKNLKKYTPQPLCPFTLRISEPSDSANIDDHTQFRKETSQKLTEWSPMDGVTQIYPIPTARNAHHMQDKIQNHNLDSPLEVHFVGEYPSRPATKRLADCFDNIPHCLIKTELTKLVDKPTYELPWRRPEQVLVSKNVPLIEVFGNYPTSNNKDSSRSSVSRANSESIKPHLPDDLLEGNFLKQMDEEANLNAPAEAAAIHPNNNLPEDLASPTTQCEHEAELPPPVRRVQRRISDGIRKCSIFMVPSSSPGKNNIINVPETKNNIILLDNEELEVENDCKELDPVRHILPISPTDLTKQISPAPTKLVQRRNSHIQLGASDKDKSTLCSPKKLHEVPVIPDAIVAEAMETKLKFKNNLSDIIKKIYTPVSLKSQAHRRYSQCRMTSEDTKSKRMLLKDKLRTDWENNFFPTRKHRGRRKSMPSTKYPIRSSLPSPILKMGPNKTDHISTAPPLKLCERRSSLVRINPWSGRNDMKDKSSLVTRNSTTSEITSTSHDHIGVDSGNAPIPKESKATIGQITPVLSPKLNATNQKLFSTDVEKNDATISYKNINQTGVEETMPKTERQNEKLSSLTIFPQPLKIIKRRHSQVYITPWSGATNKSVVLTDQGSERSTEVSAPKDTDTEVMREAHAKIVHFNVTADEVSTKVPKFPNRRKSLCDAEHHFSTKMKDDLCCTLRRKSMDAGKDENSSPEALKRELDKNVVTVPLSSKVCKVIAAQKATRNKYYSPDSPASDLPKESANEQNAELLSPNHHRRPELVITIPGDDYDKKDSHKLALTTTITDLLLAPSNTTSIELTKANDSSLLHSPKTRKRKRKKSRLSTSPVLDDVTRTKVKRSNNKHRLDSSDATEDTKQNCIKGLEEDLSRKCAKKSVVKVDDIGAQIPNEGKPLTRKQRKELSRKIKLVTSAIKNLESIMQAENGTLNANRIDQGAPNNEKISKRRGTHKKKRVKHRKRKTNNAPEHKETNNNNIPEQKDMKNIYIGRSTDTNILKPKNTNDNQIQLEHREINESDKLKRKEINNSEKLEHRQITDSDKLEHKQINDSDKLKRKEFNNSDKLEHTQINDSDKFKRKEINNSDKLERKEFNNSDKLEHTQFNDSDKFEHKQINNSDKLEHKQVNDSHKLEHKQINDSNKLKFKEYNESDKVEHKEINDSDKLKYKSTGYKLMHKETTYVSFKHKPKGTEDSDKDEHKVTVGSKKLKLKDTNVREKLEHSKTGDGDEIKHNETDINDKLGQNNTDKSDNVKNKEIDICDKNEYKDTDVNEKLEHNRHKLNHNETDDNHKFEHNETGFTDKIEQNETDNNDKLEQKQNDYNKKSEHKEIDDSKKLDHEENNARKRIEHSDRDIIDTKNGSGKLGYPRKDTTDKDKLKLKDTDDSDILKYIGNCDSDMAENIDNYDNEILQYMENYESDTDDDMEDYDSDILQYIEDYDSDVAENNEAEDSVKIDHRKTYEGPIRVKDISDALKHKETNNNDLVEQNHKETNNNMIAEQSDAKTEVFCHRNDEELDRIENSNGVLKNIKDIGMSEYRNSEEVTEHKYTNNKVADIESDRTVTNSNDVDQQVPSDVDCTDLSLSVPAHVRSIPLPPVTDIPLPPTPAPRLPAECPPGDIPLPSAPPPLPALYYSPTAQAGILPKKRTYLPLYGELTSFQHRT